MNSSTNTVPTRDPARIPTTRTALGARRVRGALARSLAACLALLATSVASALSLAEAERIAIDRDPTLRQLDAEAVVERARARIDGSLPPPQARVGIVNLPVDSFDFDADDMTMLEVGIEQEIGNGRRRELARERGEQAALALGSRLDARRLELRREVRRAWTELGYLQKAGELLGVQVSLLEQMRAAVRARYAAGEGSQVEMLRAGLESGMLRERLLDVEREATMRRVGLARWIGAEAAREAGPFVLPEPAPLAPLAELERRLDVHPSHLDYERRIEASQTGLAFAEAASKPDWMLDVSYGFRSGSGMDGESRSDMLSAMVSVGLPALRGERIDAGIAGARAEYRSLVEMHDDHRYELMAELTRAWSDAQRVDELLRLYDEELLPLAAQSGEAALLALRHDRGGVEDAIAAQQLGLETRLKRARLLADRALAQHDIDYLSGEGP